MNATAKLLMKKYHPEILKEQEKAKKLKAEQEKEQKAREQAKRDAIEYFQSLEAQ